MSTLRPILDRWHAAGTLARVPLDGVPADRVLRDQVQVALRGSGPVSGRAFVPLTPAAHQLLHGRDGAATQRVLRGLLGALDDAAAGAVALRGFSLAHDQAGFAVNLLVSNVEAGFIDDPVRGGDSASVEAAITRLLPSVRVAKAQNTGWMDLGPRVSGLLRDVAAHGAAAGRDASQELTLTVLHELQHSISAHDARTIDDRHVWLEEGIAETLAWWPGVAQGARAAMGVPARDGEPDDPHTARPETVASTEYRQRHRAVLGLLGLAGITPRRADGTIDHSMHRRAVTLLQSSPVEGVPRDLARAIARHHGIDGARDGAALAELIVDVAGRPDAVAALGELLG